eukprot:jgi/Mesvir1/25588/Mv01816-RA.1
MATSLLASPVSGLASVRAIPTCNPVGPSCRQSLVPSSVEAGLGAPHRGSRPSGTRNMLEVVSGDRGRLQSAIHTPALGLQGRVQRGRSGYRLVTKAVFERFTERAIRAVVLCQQETNDMRHLSVGLEAFLLGLIAESHLANDDWHKGRREFLGSGITIETARAVVYALVGRGKEFGPGTPPAWRETSDVPFSIECKRVFEIALEESRRLGHNYIAPEHLFLALMIVDDGSVAKVLDSLNVNVEEMQREALAALVKNEEGERTWASGRAGVAMEAVGSGAAKPKGVLADFCLDLTARAREGKIDPVIGRAVEVGRVIEILARRTKNNPVLLGEPGVGKTAIAEGLAREIVMGKVPEFLLNKRVLSLDVGGLIAGAKERGELEKRLTEIIAELKASGDVILVIDEVHTIVGSGTVGRGGMDIANIMKPALARGGLQCIGATTLDDYRKYMEKDPALQRRFQPVSVRAPSTDEAIAILMGLKGRYERHHKCTISDEAVVAAVMLSDRYIADRFLPDKAIDVMDEAGSRIAMRVYGRRSAKAGLGLARAHRRSARQVPNVEDDMTNGVMPIRPEVPEPAALGAGEEVVTGDEEAMRDAALGGGGIGEYLRDSLVHQVHAVRALKDDAAAANDFVSAQEHAAKEAELIAMLQTMGLAAEGGKLHVKSQPHESSSYEGPSSPSTLATLASMSYRESVLSSEEARTGKESGMSDGSAAGAHQLDSHVGVDTIELIVAQWTGIPIERLSLDDKSRLLNLESTLQRRLVGQDDAVRAISRALCRARVGLKDPDRPVATMLFCGPTGVGKTELCKALAQEYFGSPDAMVRLDMSEYMERHTVSKLIGSPPGYVGFGDGGTLTEAVRRRPFCIVLLDEIEKAHPDVFNILLQMFEDGRLTDSQGRVVSFKNCMIVMTSNVGSSIIARGGAGARMGFLLETGEGAEMAEYSRMKEAVTNELKTFFKPELLNRLDEITVFRQLSKDNIRSIFAILMRDVTRLMAEAGVTMEMSERLRDHVCDKGYDKTYGARPLRRAITELIEDPLSEAMLAHVIEDGDTAVMDVTEDGRVTVYNKNSPANNAAPNRRMSSPPTKAPVPESVRAFYD